MTQTENAEVLRNNGIELDNIKRTILHIIGSQGTPDDTNPVLQAEIDATTAKTQEIKAILPLIP